MITHPQFLTNQKLKTICRVALMTFILEKKFDVPTRIIITFFNKAIDLFDGIINLHQGNLDECSQALIRVLYETALKYRHFKHLIATTGPDNAAQLVLDSIYIMRARDARLQDESMGKGVNTFSKALDSIKELEKKYDPTRMKLISQHGFPCMKVEELSKKYSDKKEYEMMYRMLSRNVHATDTVEYIIKQGPLEGIDIEEHIKERNKHSFSYTFQLFFGMMIDMNDSLSLKIDKQLNEVSDEFNANLKI